MDEPQVKTSRPFNVTSAAFAFCMWGSWAFYINYDAGLDTGFISGVTQGSASFVITFFMIRAVTWLFNRLTSSVLKLIVPAVITVAFTSTCLTLIHSLVRTPNIFFTIAPALSVAFLFCIFTSYTLSKNDDVLSNHTNSDTEK